MSAAGESLRSRICVLVGCLAVFFLAVFTGVGGPPSEFEPQVPPTIAFPGKNILEIYGAGAIIAAVSIPASLNSGRVARIVCTIAYAFVTLGNGVSWAIAAGKKGQLDFAVVFAAVSAPFLLLLWWPKRGGNCASGKEEMKTPCRRRTHRRTIRFSGRRKLRAAAELKR